LVRENRDVKKSMSLDECVERAKELSRDALWGWEIREEHKGRLTQGSGFDGSQAVVDLYVAGERPTDAIVLVRVRLDRYSGEGKVEIFHEHLVPRGDNIYVAPIKTKEQAKKIAEDFLDRDVRPKLVEELVVTEVREFPTCWVAGFNTRAYVETGSTIHALAGGGPIIINRLTGKARQGTSALPAEKQLDPES
jgi:Immunity protein 35